MRAAGVVIDDDNEPALKKRTKYGGKK